jgi:hypothetical protein
MKHWIRLTYLITCLLSLYAHAASAQVRSLGLQEIVQSASSSFVGEVTGVRYGLDQNKDVVTYTTFKVDERVLGSVGSSVTIKQLGGIMNGLDTRLEHIRYFHKGEKVLVSVYPNSTMGFSNPVGLNQGVWSVSKKGDVMAIPATQLRGLESVLPQNGIPAASAHASTPVNLSVKNFTALMKSLAAAPKGGSAR